MLSSSHKLAAGEIKARPELADIFRRYGESYRRSNPLPASHRKVMRAVSVCRTQELGGHLKQCDSCGFEHPTYNSCLPVRAARRQAVTATALNASRWVKPSG